ncbi:MULTISPECIES: sulfurtransferase TusA family protein [unclassified Halomonas]|uniref:sulfurtransferase TusA family protein n=1 Tax=unclassified Halomonas TaxID=2609666 RepID=UPI0021E3F0D2|nr:MULTISPECIES: sulfurtransferase TusA family protein [unclassified Halomonas]UYG00532.1 sulfurtransferase TusA family protein [Halomonas sp. GD1P12]WNL41693.1 sulfurtransferase TusA family protein [Halomonas sp. PAMB 3264]
MTDDEGCDQKAPVPLAPDAVVDACGLACPLPLLKTKQALASIASGQLLEVVADDQGSWRDITSFTEQSAHTLEGREQRSGHYHFWIRKAGGSSL